jgi:hypothetical protein
MMLKSFKYRFPISNPAFDFDFMKSKFLNVKTCHFQYAPRSAKYCKSVFLQRFLICSQMQVGTGEIQIHI